MESIVLNEKMIQYLNRLPGYDCGLCGEKTCKNFAIKLSENPILLFKCIHLNKLERNSSILSTDEKSAKTYSKKENKVEQLHSCSSCNSCTTEDKKETWKDSLDRDFDFILDSLPGDPGPREVMKLHNPALTEKLDIKVGDIILGRPLGMSCGCPVTHCGIVMDVHELTGVITWCVTGPLGPRNKGFKDIGFYSAEAYEGIVIKTNKELKIGMRYWFMPHKCMLQWRHSAIINFINKVNVNGNILPQIRLEGLLIG